MRARLAAAGKRAGASIAVGLHRAFGSRSGSRFGILMYHRIVEPPASLPEPTWNVTPSRFAEQIRGLVESGHHIASLRSVLEDVRAARALRPKTAVVTFDDGYRNVYRHAWPILRQLGIPATLFVPTAFVDTSGPLPFDSWGVAHHAAAPEDGWRVLSWSECREMEASGLIEVGSHSHRHVDFRGDATRLRQDLATSITTLRDRLRRDDGFSFSFPYGGRQLGYASDALMHVARETGLRCALTTETELADPATDPFGWGRLEVAQTDTSAAVAAKLAGWYDWMGGARALFRRMAPPPPPAGLSPREPVAP